MVFPEFFTVNKLLSYRQDKSRKKDLKDVAKLCNEFEKNNYKKLTKKIYQNIKNFRLEDEFKLVKNYIHKINS